MAIRMFKRCAWVAVSLKQNIRQLSLTSTFNKWQPSYVVGPMTEPLLTTTVGEVVRSTAEKYPDREAVVVCHQQIRKNYAQFSNDVDKLAAGLIAIGLNKGDRIGVWSPNCYEWVLVQFASAKAGLILVNINPAYRPSELKYCLNKVGIRALVMSETFKTQNYYEMLNSIMPSLAETKPGETEDNSIPNLSHVIMLSDKSFNGVHQFQEVFEAGGTRERDRLVELEKLIQFDDPVNIQYTSGTTGQPKGVTLSHHNVINNARFYARRLTLYDKYHRICFNVPLFHCFGCVIGTLATYLTANCTVFPDWSFNARAAAETIQREKATVIYGTPTMYIDILNLPGFDNYDFSSLETGLMAGSPCLEELVRTVIEKLAKGFTTAYGSTELSPLVVMSSPTDSVKERTTTSGGVLPHSEVKVVDEKGNVVGIGSPGEFLSRGYQVMLGYWEDEEATKKTITADGWYKSGDIVVMDSKGLISITGRKKDMIIRGGENIYPSEIENFLLTHPKIAEAQVIGVPDDRMGEEICVWIGVKQNENLTSHDVKDFCKSKIAHYKIPRYVVFVDEFPKTASGKILKYVMRERSVDILNLRKPS